MSWDQIKTTLPKSRQERPCMWCPEMIGAGTAYVRAVGKFEGDFQSNNYHPECFEAAQKLFSQHPDESGFEPHSFKRGTKEKA